jgi:hypothetical protein
MGKKAPTEYSVLITKQNGSTCVMQNKSFEKDDLFTAFEEYLKKNLPKVGQSEIPGFLKQLKLSVKTNGDFSVEVQTSRSGVVLFQLVKLLPRARKIDSCKCD